MNTLLTTTFVVRAEVFAFVILLTVNLIECEESSLPTTFSFAAQNSSNGTNLVYKDSNSPEDLAISFPQHLSSPSVCGQDYRKCSILISDATASEEIVAVVLPLGEYFGVATFDNRTDLNQLTFRESHVISTDVVGCQLTLLSMSSSFSGPDRLAVVGFCQTQDLVVQLIVALNMTDLQESSLFDYQRSCPASNPSELVYFESASFPRGALVFVDGETILFLQFGQFCQSYSDDTLVDGSVCSNLEHFVGISQPPSKQVLYCRDSTGIVDVETDNLPTLSRSEFGLPFFCDSDELVAAYRNNSLALLQRRNTEGIPLNLSMEFPYGNAVVVGSCVPLGNRFFVVVQLTNGTVIAANLNASETVILGDSLVPPRVFQQSVQLVTATSLVVRSLVNPQFREEVDGRALLGAVLHGVTGDAPPTTPLTTSMTTPLTTPPPVTTSPEIVVDNNTGVIVGGVVGGFALLLVLILISVLLGIALWYCCREKEPTLTQIHEESLPPDKLSKAQADLTAQYYAESHDQLEETTTPKEEITPHDDPRRQGNGCSVVEDAGRLQASGSDSGAGRHGNSHPSSGDGSGNGGGHDAPTLCSHDPGLNGNGHVSSQPELPCDNNGRIVLPLTLS